MKVGITIVVKPKDSLWKNGIIQNCLYFYETINNISTVDKVCLLQLSSPDYLNKEDVDFLKDFELEFWHDNNLDYIKEEFDVIVTLGGIPTTKQVSHYKTNLKNRLVAYKGGNEFVNRIEGVIYGDLVGWPNILKDKTPAEKPIGYDEVWMVPQQEFNNKEYFELHYECDSRVTPFLWSPKFIEGRAKEIDPEGMCLFSNKDFDSWTFSCFEPNMSILKNMMPPIYAAEHAYRCIEDKDKISRFMFTNASGHTKDKTLIHIVKDLQLFKDKKITFEARYSTVDFLQRYTNGVISHQWGNALNYAYLDICYLGYPLVHNAHLCSDIGYYYEGWKVKEAGSLILEVIRNHKNDTSYIDKQRSILKRYEPSNTSIINQYELLLNNLFEKNEINATSYNWKNNLLE